MGVGGRGVGRKMVGGWMSGGVWEGEVWGEGCGGEVWGGEVNVFKDAVTQRERKKKRREEEEDRHTRQHCILGDSLESSELCRIPQLASSSPRTRTNHRKKLHHN